MKIGWIVLIVCCVKHLNPRQGITTQSKELREQGVTFSVKHLNPRQGITTAAAEARRKKEEEKV